MSNKRKKRLHLPSTTDELVETELLKMVADEMQREITINQGGEQQQVAAANVLFRKIIQTAINGSPHSQRLSMEMMAAASMMKSQQHTLRTERFKKFKVYQYRALKKAEADGKSTRLILPHPDDIVIDEEQGVGFRGPINEQELRCVENTIQYRDTLILQDALDQRLLIPDSGEQFVTTSALIFAHVFNDLLPSRFRWDVTVLLLLKIDKRSKYTKRELLKRTFQAWKRLGHPKPRGYTSPLYRDIQDRTKRRFKTINRILDTLNAGKKINNHEIDAWIMEMS